MNLSLKITRPGSLAVKRQSANVSTKAVKEVFMPALSSTMTEGKIVSWLKAPGDKVTKGEALVVVESGTLVDDGHFSTCRWRALQPSLALTSRGIRI